MNSTATLCRLEDIPDGEARGFDPAGVGRDTLFIVRQGQGLHGWYDRCPHEGDTPLPWRRHGYLNKKRTRIVCFAHGAQFEIASGMCILGPCLGERLDPVQLVIHPDGEVVMMAVPPMPAAPCPGPGSDMRCKNV
ncbi:Rieske (2Fe-2S) protein [Noviherbaspirillum saxi]|uniref:Rieske (2Fe-2S) protein n=1 Tax=Noviherbaspirillum saxi TaxID=2320863 RepID=A0A3A3FJU0_9BURK|nr:Rieske (2Fe-2S) protein [Noviherbaspirillum saxi]RJF95788.1 Rieske (2Fe-2S) protein [Noviherbaspirillum saxi]